MKDLRIKPPRSRFLPEGKSSPRKKKQQEYDALGLPQKSNSGVRQQQQRWCASTLAHSPVISPFTRSKDVKFTFARKEDKGRPRSIVARRPRERQQEPKPSERRPKIQYIEWDNARRNPESNSRSSCSSKISMPKVAMHSTLMTFDEGQDATEHLSTSQASVLRLFMMEWLASFEQEKNSFQSIGKGSPFDS